MTITGCLHSLAFPEINHREYDITPQADKTCLWLLKHKVFLEWLGQSHEILWLKGKPGAGKSTLLKNAFRETKKNELSQNKLVVASHFFHGRGSQIQKVPLGLFRSLLHQLLEKIPNVLSELTEKFQTKVKTQGDPGSRWNWHPMELQESLTTSLLRAGRSYKLKIFVDALDECGEEAAIELVRYFQRVVTASRQAGGSLSICFSCRHYPIISLDGAFEICVEDENKIDIESYIQNELQSIRDQTKISILQEQITARASGSFQWVTLVVPRICQLHRKGKSLRVIQSHIEKIPAELNNLYRQLLESIEEESVSQSLHIMQWICFATRPLTLDELRHAIAVDADTPYKSLKECRGSPEYADTLEEMEFRLKDLCRGLAETKEHKNGRVVQFIHQSVNDFLIQEGLKMLEHSSESADQVIGRAHLRLSMSCIRYIDMEEIGLWVHHIKSEAPRIFYHLKPYIPPELLFIEYASTQLFLHAKTSETKGVLQSDLHIFFQWLSNKTVQRWNFIHNIFLSHQSLKGATLLHIASFYRLISVVEAILKMGADVDSKDSKYGRTPLLFAAKEGHDVVVELLLKKDADVNSKDKYGTTPLSYAASGGHVAVLELLLEKGANVHEDNQGISYAASGGHVAVLELLLEKGANVYHEDKHGRTPLSFAAECGKEAAIKFLLEKAVKVNSRDCNGRTPLSHASKRGYAGIVMLLLEKGANVDDVDKSGNTPLSLAVVPRSRSRGHVAVAKLLLESGRLKEKTISAALSLAKENSFEEGVELLEEWIATHKAEA
jgi:ankyrin repeat protein